MLARQLDQLRARKGVECSFSGKQIGLSNVNRAEGCFEDI